MIGILHYEPTSVHVSAGKGSFLVLKGIHLFENKNPTASSSTKASQFPSMEKAGHIWEKLVFHSPLKWKCSCLKAEKTVHSLEKSTKCILDGSGSMSAVQSYHNQTHECSIKIRVFSPLKYLLHQNLTFSPFLIIFCLKQRNEFIDITANPFWTILTASHK